MMFRAAVKHRMGAFELDVAFEAEMPAVIGVFGPSGAGKSTLLNAIAGIIKPRSCKISLGENDLDRLSADRRGIGVVFQDGRLFPHMNVQDNLAYGLMRAPHGRIGGDEVSQILGLQSLLRRKPASLSGGERQRVAIGRALLSQPRMLLMDEPLASLDGAKKAEILPYLAKLRRAFEIPILYVSHDLQEVTGLADMMLLMDHGKMVAFGPVSEIAARADLPLSARPDAAGVLIGKVSDQLVERGLTQISCGGQPYLVPEIRAELNAAVRIRVPARDVILAWERPRNISVSNVIAAQILGLSEEVERSVVFVEMEVGGGQIVAHVTADSANRMQLRKGEEVFALIKAMSVEVLA